MNAFDWNWFFAAYAQCGAALIGIISAFIISKLLGENDKYETITEKLESSVIKKNDLLKRISNRYFDWHDRLSIKHEYDLGEAIENGEFSGLSNEKKLEKLYEIIPALYKVESCIDYLDSRINEASQKTSGSYLGSSLRSLDITPVGLWDKIIKEREVISQLKIESETLIEEFHSILHTLEATRNNLNPIKNTIYILSLGLLMTVIYPLHFMPLEVNQLPIIGFSLKIIKTNLYSIKGLLLVVLTVTIESIFVYFFLLLVSLNSKYKQSIESIDEQWLNLNYYSEYFE